MVGLLTCCRWDGRFSRFYLLGPALQRRVEEMLDGVVTCSWPAFSLGDCLLRLRRRWCSRRHCLNRSCTSVTAVIFPAACPSPEPKAIVIPLSLYWSLP